MHPALLLVFLPLTTALPQPQSQSQPSPSSSSSSCLSAALALKTVTLSNTEVIRGSPFNQQPTSVSFQVTNPTTGVVTRCNASDIALTPNGVGSDPYKWYECVVTKEGGEGVVNGDGRRGEEYRARFQYDATLNFLTVEEGWVCEGDDERVLVTAELWDELPIDWCVSEGGFGTRCKQEGSMEFGVKVTVKEL